MIIPRQPNMYCYNETAKDSQSRSIKRIYRHVQKQLPDGFVLKSHFNRGGIAVFGETYAKIYLNGAPVVEAYDTSMGLLVRQWDGRNSGRNIYVDTVDSFVATIRQLSAMPFVRF